MIMFNPIKMKKSHTVVTMLIIICYMDVVIGDDPITPNEKAAIKKFRPMVKDLLTHDYMNSDTYLIRWIRARELDLNSAKELLMNNLKWRKENDIDNLKPNKSFQKVFGVHLTGVDKEGRPVITIDATGDLRKFVVAGKRHQLGQHFISAYELAEQRIWELNQKNNSEFIAIYDFNNFTPRTHLCVSCLPIYLDHAIHEEFHYTFSVREIFALNAPRAFQTVLRLVGPVLRDRIKKVKTYLNRAEWQPELLRRIPADQLTPQFGGTKGN